MLTPLSREFVTQNFRMFQPYMEKMGADALAVLREVQMGRMQLWAVSEKRSESETVALGIVATSIVVDHLTGSRDLLVNALYKASSDVHISDDLWTDGLASLKLYAASENCRRVVAFSDNRRVIEMFERNGGDSSMRFLRMEVNG